MVQAARNGSSVPIRFSWIQNATLSTSHRNNNQDVWSTCPKHLDRTISMLKRRYGYLFVSNRLQLTSSKWRSLARCCPNFDMDTTASDISVRHIMFRTAEANSLSSSSYGWERMYLIWASKLLETISRWCHWCNQRIAIISKTPTFDPQYDVKRTSCHIITADPKERLSTPCINDNVTNSFDNAGIPRRIASTFMTLKP